MDTFAIIYSADRIPQNIIDIVEQDLRLANAQPGNWDGYDSVWAEQYMRMTDPKDGWYFVSVLDDDSNYIGGVFLFMDNPPEDLETPLPAFQGIAKSRFGSTTSIRLNSILIPAILDHIKQAGKEKVYVLPYGKQADILRKHFGFEGRVGDILHKHI